MSGICGIVRFDGENVKKEEIQKMCMHEKPW